MYDNEDKEEILLDKFRKWQKMYAKEGKYDTVGNPNQPAIQRPQPAPPQPPSTTKKGNTKKRKTIQLWTISLWSTNFRGIIHEHRNVSRTCFLNNVHFLTLCSSSFPFTLLSLQLFSVAFNTHTPFFVSIRL